LHTICRWNLEIIPPFFKAHNSNTHLSSMNLSIMPNNIKTLNTNCDVNLKKHCHHVLVFFYIPSYKCLFFYKMTFHEKKTKKKNDKTTKVFAMHPWTKPKNKNKKNSQTPLPCHPSPLYPATPPPKEKKGGHWGACWLTSLAARNF